MSKLFDFSSLAMIPTAYKDGKLYSVRPTDGDGDFTFSRGSNLAATRVDVNGLIEKGRENLLLQSNQFDTTWTLTSSISLTSGQSGYDGSNDAWLLKRSDTSARRTQQVITPSGVQTYSVYAKAESVDWLFLFAFDGSSSYDAYFDLASGVVGTKTNLIDAKIESVGNGWYRCSITYTAAITFVRIYPAVADGNITGGISPAGIYIQDAQLEQGLVATDYIETGTGAAQSGILEDMPRLDYSGGASCPSLLLEPSRTNIHTNSEYVDAYVKSRSTITTNATTSPEGVSNASKVIPLSSSTGWAGVNAPNYSFTSGDTYTLSVFAKAGEYDYCQVGGSTPAFNGSFATINLTNGVVEHQSGITATTEDYGSGWWRISFTHTAIATASSPIGFFAVYSTAVSSRLVTQVGDNTSGVYIYGWQAEAASYPTSYIPTYGTSVTRSDDDCENTSATSLIGQSEGTLFTQVGDFPQEVNGRIFAISDGSSNNYITIIKSGSNNNFALYVNTLGVTQVAYAGSGSLNDNSKIAVGYANNDFVVYVNGTLVHSDSSASVPACSSVWIGQRENGSRTYIAGGGLKQAVLFKTRLTNTELASLTTL